VAAPPPLFSRVLVPVLVLVLAPAAAEAQVVGSITGVVTDQNGRPLPGVRLSTTSTTQIGGARAVYSAADGSFRFPGLQPGVFELIASAPRLKSVVQKGIHVGVKAPAEVDVLMEVETAVEEVKVIEKAPVISTTSATVKEVFDADFVDGLPLDKRTGYGGFIRDNVPGAAEGGPNPAIGDWTVRVRGANNTQNAILVEGFLMNGQKITLNSLAAMEVETAGNGAENAGSPGAVVNMVTQSGSNRLALDLTTWHEDSHLRLFQDRTDPGNKVRNTFLNPALSGPIVKDRLWFYANLETRGNATYRDPDPTGIGGTPPPRWYWNVRGTLKLTWQVTPRNKLQSFTLLNREGWTNYREGWDVDKEAQIMRDWFDYFTGVTWESLLSDELFFKSQVGVQRFFRLEQPELCRNEPGDCLHVIPTEQLHPRRTYLGNYDKINQLDDSAFEVVNTLEWFLGSRRFGDHSLKGVSRFLSRIYQTTDGVPGDAKEIFNGPEPARRQDFYSNDPRLEEPRFGYVVRSSSGYRFSNSLSDTIRFTRFFTVTPGLALTINRAGTSLVGTVIDQTALTPHLQAAYDITHDGRTVLRASYNHYVDTDAVRIARHALGDAVVRECRWNPATNSFDSDCRFSGGAGGRTFGLPCGPSGLADDGGPCREKLRIPRTIEYTAGAERELVPGLALGADLVYRVFHTPYERRETNRVWNDAGTELSRLGAFRNGRAQTIDDLGTPSGAQRRYTGVTASLKKRDGALKVTTSYTWSRLEGNVPLEEDNELGDIPPRDTYLWGFLPYDRRHELRASATYQLTRWLSLGVNYNHYSGGPYSRKFFNQETGRFDDYRARAGNDPGANLNDPGDDRQLRLPDVQRLNLQVRAHLRPLLKKLDLEIYADALNVLGLRTTNGVYTDEGPSFGQPTGRLDPFRIRLGARFRY
jgi:hypothetical protein